MIDIAEVLTMIRPNGGWAISGEDYESLFYDATCEPITREEFDNALERYPASKAEQEATNAADKAALLDRLGITADEAKLLLS